MTVRQNGVRESILEAAKVAFSSKSYADVSMEDIAKLANVKKPLIYYYFPSKEELFKATWDEAFHKLEDKVFGISENDNKYVRKAKAFLRAYIDFLRNDRQSLRLIEREKTRFYSETGSSWQHIKTEYDGFVNRVADVLSTEIDTDSKEYARAITDIVGSSALLPEGQMSPDTIELIIIKGLAK
ncbi:TetR/AcrR family transcriptional regulator [Athalassotoga saccharophila]|uniref:TetR/AcrR family transcriptional regulator n=1 Tax=Athalassotoga saccharophila TaxID=1441386 RepID=UPI001379E2FC|nr:TetR/AcrR family transcriptional regulator [Athalassotoga saccharophila]BBJ28863.1 HTH-type transcriptional regulator TtgR [Athalassotoga saccharophila]